MSDPALPATAPVADRLRPILADVFNVPANHLSTKPENFAGIRFAEDLAGDSLDWVELILKAEDTFGIEITDDEGEVLRTVGDAVTLIERKLAAQVA